MSEPLLLREVIPPLTARTAEGKIVRAWDYKQKNPLVIVFLQADCSQCDDWLHQFAAHAAELIERGAIALIIYAEPTPRKAELLPVPFLAAADPTGRSQCAFLGPESFGSSGLTRVGAFVTDRYGELFEQWIGRDAGELPSHAKILDTLGVIQMIC